MRNEGRWTRGTRNGSRGGAKIKGKQRGGERVAAQDGELNSGGPAEKGHAAKSIMDNTWKLAEGGHLRRCESTGGSPLGSWRRRAKPLGGLIAHD